jgi:hypothetical protein
MMGDIERILLLVLCMIAIAALIYEFG